MRYKPVTSFSISPTGNDGLHVDRAYRPEGGIADALTERERLPWINAYSLSPTTLAGIATARKPSVFELRRQPMPSCSESPKWSLSRYRHPRSRWDSLCQRSSRDPTGTPTPRAPETRRCDASVETKLAHAIAIGPQASVMDRDSVPWNRTSVWPADSTAQEKSWER